jgi:hypothetical protein
MLRHGHYRSCSRRYLSRSNNTSKVLIPAIAPATFQPGLLYPSIAARMREGLVLRWHKYRRRAAEQQTPPQGSTKSLEKK